MKYFSMNGQVAGILADIASAVAGFYLTYFGLVELLVYHPFRYGGSKFLETELLCLISWIIALALMVEYPNRRMSVLLQELGIVFKVNLIGVLLFSALSFAFKLGDFSRMFVSSYFVVLFLTMFVNRLLIRLVLHVIRRYGWDSRTRIIIGSDELAQRYVHEAQTRKRLGLRIIGYVADSQVVGVATQYLGSIPDLERILAKHLVDGVVIALRITDPNVDYVMEACEKQGISIELLLDSLSSRIAISHVHHGVAGSSLMLSAIPHTPSSLMLKRFTDIAISALALVILGPVFLAVTIAIKLDDSGPVFFRQERIGERNKSFSIFKFRSMRVDAEDMKPFLEHLNEMSGPVFKLTDDPRVTRVGKFLRRTSLDELPQLFNVLKGNMSLVGPRPPLPSEVQQYHPAHRKRLSVKPGITCLWQISGRNNIDFDEWMSLDLTYIDNWSYVGDLKIMAKTIPAVLKGVGAR